MYLGLFQSHHGNRLLEIQLDSSALGTPPPECLQMMEPNGCAVRVHPR
jgi:hypothetical protein